MSLGSRNASTLEPPRARQRSRPAATRLAGCVLGLLLPELIVAAPAPSPSPAKLAPRPISETERAGIELAIRYLEGGASAWWDRLASDSALRALGREEAIREIEVRLGPVDGTTWELRTMVDGSADDLAVFTVTFPSGAEETARLGMLREAGSWRLAALETTVDPLPAISPLLAHPGAAGPRASRRSAPTRTASPAPLAAVLASALLMALLSLSRRPARRLAARLTAIAVAIAAAAAGLSCGKERRAETAGEKPTVLRLATLAPLRTALLLGGDPATAARELAAGRLSPDLAEVRRLWEADERLREGDLPRAETLLRQSPRPSVFPLAALLRARLAAAQLRTAEAGKAYDEAMARRLDHDGLHLEAAEAHVAIDDEVGASFELQLLAESGSRIAEAWYGAARVALIEDRESAADDLLRTAWMLRPLPRRELFADPLLAAVAAKPALFPLLDFASPNEPRLADKAPRKPLAFPAGCAVTTSGGALRARIHSARLELPGGASLAPDGAVVVDAATWTDEDETRALARLAELRLASAARSGAPSSRLVRQAQLAGSALARQNRWRELEELTAPLVTSDPPSVPLSRLRALALTRLERAAEARALLVRVATVELARRAPASGTLYDLAELLAKAGDYERAMQLVRKADARMHKPRGELRLRQLALDQLLASSFRSFRSQHFDIRFPATAGESYARQIATVLEQERQREGQWVPLVEGPRIEVNLFDMGPFFGAYGDMGVVGIFDGRVRVPFADLQSLHPELVRILSHELCHALIAQATHDRAPAWFHEGLAQHVEMGTGRPNPLPDLRSSGRAIAFPIVSAILAGFAEPQFVELAYSEAAWAVHLLESRWGTAGLRRLMTAFAAGETDEQALRQTTGLDLASFDRAFWEWGSTRAPAVRELAVRRFDQELDGPIRRQSAALAAAAPSAPTQAGKRGTSEPGSPPSMADWHRLYSSRIAATRQAIAPILVAYQGGKAPAAPDGCARLENEVAALRAESSLLDCPERTAARALRDAYYQLQQMLGQCKIGRHDLARDSSTRAIASLQAATAALQPYGVAP